MPNLFVVAGCNGSGKSTFAQSFLPDGLTSFDFDKLFLEYYNELPDSELRDKIARNLTSSDFQKAIELSIKTKSDFCYETNLDSSPVHWPNQFRLNGYELHVIFFCLQDQKIARNRVMERTEFKGHFVDNTTIDYKWKEGYKNFNEHYTFFDRVLIVDNSRHKEIYTNILQINKDIVELMDTKVPNYFQHRLPRLYKLI